MLTRGCDHAFRGLKYLPFYVDHYAQDRVISPKSLTLHHLLTFGEHGTLLYFMRCLFRNVLCLSVAAAAAAAAPPTARVLLTFFLLVVVVVAILLLE